MKFNLKIKLNEFYAEIESVSMGSANKETELDAKLAHELRQGYGLAASFYRAAAAQTGMTDTDMQVIDLLESSGDATAGQLANLMGLTTGTFTAILNRLEKAGLVRRERDPDDGRRVIVRLAPAAKGTQATSTLFASLGNGWEALAAQYDDEQKALLWAFLQQSNAIAREEIALMRETTVDSDGFFTAPPGDLKWGQIVIISEGLGLNLRAGDLEGALYEARFEGSVPDVKVKEGVVTIRYPRRLWLPGMKKRIAEVTLSTAIPWSIVIRSGGSDLSASLNGLNLREMEVQSAGSMVRVELDAPSGAVPLRLGGGGSEFTVRRPQGVGARVQMKGWGSAITFDNEMVTGMGSDGRVYSPGFDLTAPYYDIGVESSGSQVTIASG